jgi:hypothetical protein
MSVLEEDWRAFQRRPRQTLGRAAAVEGVGVFEGAAGREGRVGREPARVGD